jgi:hypothetical protein
MLSRISLKKRVSLYITLSFPSIPSNPMQLVSHNQKFNLHTHFNCETMSHGIGDDDNGDLYFLSRIVSIIILIKQIYIYKKFLV